MASSNMRHSIGEDQVNAATKNATTIGTSHGTLVRPPQLAESFFTANQHKRERLVSSSQISSFESSSSSTQSGSSRQHAQQDKEDLKSEQDNNDFNSDPHRALEVPKLFCCERENPIEPKPNQGSISESSAPRFWSLFVPQGFYSPERIHLLLPPSSSSSRLRMNENSKSSSAPMLISTHTGCCDSHLQSKKSKQPQNEKAFHPNPMLSSATPAEESYGSASPNHRHCAQETVLTDLLEDFFFGGKRIPTPEPYENHSSLDNHSNISNDSGSCCSLKKNLSAPASPTTVTATCFCADDDGPEQQPLLLENGNESYRSPSPQQMQRRTIFQQSFMQPAATAPSYVYAQDLRSQEEQPLLLENGGNESYGIPELPKPPPPPPSPQQMHRRTIFERSSMPFYPTDVASFRRPMSQRSSSLSSLPSSTTTKISNHSYHGHVRPLSHGRKPSKPALKRCSSLGKALPEHGQEPRQPPHKVSFGTLQFREYDIALSDHPGCSYGPPIQLAWDYGDETTVVTLDDYERHRIPRRSGHQLVLSGHDRRHCLQTAGYSKAELQKAVQEVEKVKRQRLLTKTTDKLLVLSRLDEFWEHCIQWVQGIFHSVPQERLHQEVSGQ